MTVPSGRSGSSTWHVIVAYSYIDQHQCLQVVSASFLKGVETRRRLQDRKDISYALSESKNKHIVIYDRRGILLSCCDINNRALDYKKKKKISWILR